MRRGGVRSIFGWAHNKSIQGVATVFFANKLQCIQGATIDKSMLFLNSDAIKEILIIRIIVRKFIEQIIVLYK